MIAAARLIVGLVMGVGLLGAPASGQQQKPPGPPAGRPAAGPAVEEAAPGEGTILGQVFDGETGVPLDGVTVVLLLPPAPGSTEPRREVRSSGPEGGFKFSSVPPGTYTLQFTKPGYRDSALKDYAVKPDQLNRADFPLPPLPREAADAAPDVEEFVVVGTPVDLEALELRIESDELLNVLSAEELAKFAAGDVAESLNRIAGVNVVEGQFAIIRGLEDRYSSTLYNGAPVPSPDPDKQSVQLDLFPSDIVSNIVVAKTFGPDLPSNSSGGSIDIITHDYPEAFEFKLSGGGGFEENALDRFIELNGGSPIGSEVDSSDVIESDFGASIGGRGHVAERELRFKALINNEIDYRTREGFQEGREPRLCLDVNQPCQLGDTPTRSGDLSLGELFLSNGRFDLTESEREDQLTGYGGFGFDLDGEGRHRIDSSIFYTDKQNEVVQLRENGFLPNFDYGVLAQKQANGEDILTSDYNDFATLSSFLRNTVRERLTDGPARGAPWYSSFGESRSFDTERDLLLYQVNGDHELETIEGLRISWAANQAETTQEESALGAQFFFEPDDITQPPPTDFPVRVEDLGPGRFASGSGIVFSENDIEENQDFGRLDVEYETDLSDELTVRLSTGGWYEQADRNVTSSFLEGVNVGGSTQFAILGDTPEELGEAIFDEASGFLRESTNDSSRELTAWHLGGKATFWEDVDLLGGFRLERIFIESINDPFTGEPRFGAPAAFPEAYLFFDRLDNPARGEVIAPPPPGTVFNDQLLGIKVPVDPATGLVDLLDEESILSLANGEIDETHFLPSVGLAYRPLEGLAWRGAYSRTVARPSFREMGFYVSVEPGTDDLVVGNPQLGLSEVESFDTRVEYTWGDFGELAALSLFYKTIEDPIESIVIRNPLNFEQSSSALFRTFFNNPNEATLRGVEVEARKNFGFAGPEIAQYFSLGGNFTYIDAEVDRTEAELARSTPFFGVVPGENERFSELEESRRLFGQPEWIANADFTFDHPDWGTKATLAFFAISDVLDAAGSAFIRPDGIAQDFTLDRYVDSYYQLDFIVSQQIWRGLALKVSVKNLTDSTRQIIYDPDQTRSEIEERSFKVGRDYSFSLSYTWDF